MDDIDNSTLLSTPKHCYYIITFVRDSYLASDDGTKPIEMLSIQEAMAGS